MYVKIENCAFKRVAVCFGSYLYLEELWVFFFNLRRRLPFLFYDWHPYCEGDFVKHNETDAQTFSIRMLMCPSAINPK